MSKFSPSELIVLNTLYSQAGDSTIPGTWLVANSVTSDKLQLSSFYSTFAPAGAGLIPGTWLATSTVPIAALEVPNVLRSEEFVATAGQTTFALSRTAVSELPNGLGVLLVFVNDAHVARGRHYAYTQGSNIVFATPLNINDIVTVYYSA